MPVWIAAIAVLATATGIALFDGEAGVATWLDLREEARISRGRIQALEHELERLAAEIEAFDSDDLAVERAIREDLELARPGEWVVRFPPSDPASRSLAGAGATARFP